MLHETPARFGRKDVQNIMGFQMAVAFSGTTLLPPIFGVFASNSTFALLPFFFLIYVMPLNTERVSAFMRPKV